MVPVAGRDPRWYAAQVCAECAEVEPGTRVPSGVLSQRDLAGRTRITRAYLSRIEAGPQDPRLSVVRRLAKALGVTVGQLVD